MSLDSNVIWHYSYGGDEEDHCFGMDVKDESDIFLAGHTLSGTQNWDTYTVKINNNGGLLLKVIQEDLTPNTSTMR